MRLARSAGAHESCTHESANQAFSASLAILIFKRTR
jgi:hypothetical protein